MDQLLAFSPGKEQAAGVMLGGIGGRRRRGRQRMRCLDGITNSMDVNLGKLQAGVGCHFLLQCMKVESESEVAQLCLTLSDPMDCSLPGSSIHGILHGAAREAP